MRFFTVVVVLVVAGALSGLSSLANSNEFQSKTFVHLFEWRWNDIANECETFLGPNGYDAIQVSPANEHINYPSWWARYQPVTFDRFTSFSGTEDELRSMIDRCHDAGVKVYADAVINHTADYEGEGVGTAGTAWSLMNHPGLSEENYHADCTIQSYQRAAEVQECKLGALPDLDTSQPYVQQMLIDYLNRLADLGFDGVRIDAAKHISLQDLSEILGAVTNDFIFLEVIGDPSAESLLQPATYAELGLVTDFEYRGALYDALRDGSSGVRRVLEFEGSLRPNGAVVFVDNHDTERHTSEISFEEKRFTETLLLLSRYGYPKILSGYQFEDRDQRPADLNQSCGEVWTCWHRDPVVNFFVNARASWASDTMGVLNRASNNAIWMKLGTKIVIFNASNEPHRIELDSGLPQGEYCSLAPEDLSTLTVGWFGSDEAQLQPWKVSVFDAEADCD